MTFDMVNILMGWPMTVLTVSCISIVYTIHCTLSMGDDLQGCAAVQCNVMEGLHALLSSYLGKVMVQDQICLTEARK